MRSFPGATRQRLTAAFVGLVSVAALAVPLAHAAPGDPGGPGDPTRDLKQKQRDVAGQIDRVSGDLNEVSRRAANAELRVQTTSERLARARGRLTEVRGRLEWAQGRLTTVRGQVAQAERDLATADAALDTAVGALGDQRSEARTTLIRLSTLGDPRLRAVHTLFSNGSIDDVARQRTTDEVLVGKQATAIDVLAEAAEELTEERDAVREIEQRLTERRAEAADVVDRISGLYGRARAGRESVETLVDDARTARAAAWETRAEYRDQLRALRAREAKIRQRLVELARRQALHRGYTGATGGFLSRPTDAPISSGFGMRMHPILGYARMHSGTDFAAPCGSALRAVADGRVFASYYDSGYGNRVFLALGNVNGHKLVVSYNHLTSSSVSVGQRVRRGDVVGLAGTTGLSTGCHLHFEVLVDGVPVDPMTYL